MSLLLPKDFRADINGLRALAVALVVLFHFRWASASGGFIGVDVFFVISGYLMSAILSRQQGTLTDCLQFYAARFRRIVPALFVMVLFVGVLAWWTLDPFEYVRLAKHARYSLFFISNIFYARGAGYFDIASESKWLLHTWSLSVEWQFYLLFPLLWIGFYRKKASVKTQFWVCAVLAAALFINCALATAGNPSTYFFSLKSRAWEMLVGALVFLAPRMNMSSRLASVLQWLGLGVIVTCGLTFSERLIWPAGWAAIPVLGAALVIFAAQPNPRWASNRFVRWLGLRSYSLYLWHWPVMVYLVLIKRAESAPALIAGVLASVVLAELSYRWVELPGKVLITGSRTKILGYVALWAGLTFGLTAALIAKEGVYSRFGSDEAQLRLLDQARDDWKNLEQGAQLPPISAALGSNNPQADLTVILGDSHAEHWFARFYSQTDRPANIVFITRGGCLPIEGFARQVKDVKCERFLQVAWQKVAELKPARLVIAGAWPTYFLDPQGRFTNLSCIQTEQGCRPIEGVADMRFLLERFSLQMKAAQLAGTKVMLLGTIPLTEASYPIEMSRKLSRPWLPLRREGPVENTSILSGQIDEPTFRRWAQPVTDELRHAAEAAGAEYVDMISRMCTDQKCPLVDASGKPRYKDNTHLRPATAQSDEFQWLDALVFARKQP